MKNTYSISVKRLLLLIRNSIIIDRNFFLIIAAVFSALLILSRIANAFSDDAPYSYGVMFFLFLYISGFLMTIGLNKELHDKRKANTFFLLPASILEKFISLLILPTLLLVVGLTIYMTIMSHLIEFGIAMLINTDINAFNPFRIEIPKGIATYVAIQAPFLLGAMYFKKHAISYTFLLIFLYHAIFWTFVFFTGKFFLGEYLKPILPGFSVIGGVIQFGEIDTLYAMAVIDKLRLAIEFWKPIGTIFTWFIAPLLWWAAAFFSLKETEL